MRNGSILVCLLTLLIVGGCGPREEAPPTAPAPPPAPKGFQPAIAPIPPVPAGLPPVPVPEDNPLTPEKVALGKQLYFDARLSRDNTVACATCHDPTKGFTDQAPVSTGIDGQQGGRSAPTVLNSAYNLLQFWDGRAPSLEAQAKGPIENPIEMGFTHAEVVARLQSIPGYVSQFQAVFGTGTVTIDHVAQAIAAFERTVLSGNSAFDRYAEGKGDPEAMTAAQQRGLELFRNKARCIFCHAGFNFTDNDFHNIGVGMDQEEPDLGRFDQTRDEQDKGAFKTPTLRDVTKTAPYMHDGSQATLEEVIEFYDQGGHPNPGLDIQMRPLKLTEGEKADLLAFLTALDGEPREVSPPPLPPAP